jgi:IclR family acetate operon transcriptional repressor
MPRTGQPSAQDIEATVRAVSILDALADGSELGTTELSRKTAISPSTVSRQLGTLARLGLVERVQASGRYRMGVRVLRLANAVLGRLDLRNIARPLIEQLVADVGETATLSIPDGSDALTVDFVPTDKYVRGVTHLGRPSIGHATSAGKVLLAFGSHTLPDGPLVAYTPKTIVDPARLEAEVEEVRRSGYAVAVDEREPGLSAIAAPIWSAEGELAAILALQGPSSRFTGATLEHAVQPLLACARDISSALGWHEGEHHTG